MTGTDPLVIEAHSLIRSVAHEMNWQAIDLSFAPGPQAARWGAANR
ncbi:hypothetical protein [Williamsia sp. CHRR-6]|nr:hypothetical protein [Williamsia sp. CHRR-6]MBT0565752.1 hypothetical protein [Williamsia sp. CHRR-6]